MKNATTIILLLVFCLSLSVIGGIFFVPAQEGNRAPFVSNVTAQQRFGTKLVDITYDVDDPDGDLLTITVAISDNGGQTFTVPAKTFTGNVGVGVIPGKGKKIVWNAGVDVPNVFGVNYQAKITASDGKAGAPTIVGKDGAIMALIPAGDFQMGDSFNEGSSDERPVHTVYIDAFYIDVYEVTNAQYKKFMDATGYKSPPFWDDYRFNAPDRPVVGVSWHDAVVYADWAGKRLPTEAEWEKAARGGLVGKRYPLGDTITRDDANYDHWGTGGKDIWPYTSPVGSFAPNGYGLYDMAGNVYEWVADWHAPDYYAYSPGSNPKGPNSGSSRVLRGGSWHDALAEDHGTSCLRVATRYSSGPTFEFYYIGFRCAGL